MAYRPLTKLRPRFVTSERPQPPVGYDGEEEVETSLSDLVYQSYKARQMSYNPQPTHESIEEMSGLSLSPHSEAPVLSDKAQIKWHHQVLLYLIPLVTVQCTQDTG